MMSTGNFRKQREEPLNPTIDRPAVSDEASLGEPLDDVTVAQRYRPTNVSIGQRHHREATVRESTGQPGGEAALARMTAPALSAKSRLSVLTCPLAVAPNTSHDQSFLLVCNGH